MLLLKGSVTETLLDVSPSLLRPPFNINQSSLSLRFSESSPTEEGGEERSLGGTDDGESGATLEAIHKGPLKKNGPKDGTDTIGEVCT